MKPQPLAYRAAERVPLKPHWALFFPVCLMSAVAGLMLSGRVETVLRGRPPDLAVFIFEFCASLLVIAVEPALYILLPRRWVGCRLFLPFGGGLLAPAFRYVALWIVEVFHI